MRLKFWKGPALSDDDLVRDADWQAEQAKHALRDGELEHALRWSDWTVTNTREVLRRRRKQGAADRHATEVFADRLWDRALIHHRRDTVPDAIRDATEALALYGDGPADKPLLVPSLKLLLCELHAEAGDEASARRYGTAIEVYETETDYPEVVLANGFDHYGRAMHLIGDLSAGPALRRAVDLFHRRDRRGDNRATVEHFIGTAILIADIAQPPVASEAPEILAILRNAAAWAERLPRPGYAGRFTAGRVQQRIAQWEEAGD